MAKRRQLKADRIRKVRHDLDPEFVPVPEWAPRPGEDDYEAPAEGAEPDQWGVHVRPLASWERRDWKEKVARAQKRMPDAEEPEFATEMLLVYGVCDEDGNPLLTMADLKVLSQRSSGAVQRLAGRILHLSGLTEASRAEMEKNSATTQRSNSGSSWATDTENPTTADLNGSSHHAGSPC